jgi:hypothetical protein
MGDISKGWRRYSKPAKKNKKKQSVSYSLPMKVTFIHFTIYVLLMTLSKLLPRIYVSKFIQYSVFKICIDISFVNSGWWINKSILFYSILFYKKYIFRWISPLTCKNIIIYLIRWRLPTVATCYEGKLLSQLFLTKSLLKNQFLISTFQISRHHCRWPTSN